jgi:hypothetical protein
MSLRTARSRNTIRRLRPLAYKLSPSASRQRGLAAIGIELESPIGMQPVDTGATVVRCSEEHDGKLVGELAVEVFRAALVIDRDGILEEKAHDAADAEHGRVTPPVPVTLPGASGFRAEVVRGKQQLPYVYLFAVAPDDLGVDGGVLVTVRSASPDWPAANEILRTLRVLGRRATTNRAANDDADVLQLPLIPPLRR